MRRWLAHASSWPVLHDWRRTRFLRPPRALTRVDEGGGAALQDLRHSHSAVGVQQKGRKEARSGKEGRGGGGGLLLLRLLLAISRGAHHRQSPAGSHAGGAEGRTALKRQRRAHSGGANGQGLHVGCMRWKQCGEWVGQLAGRRTSA